MTRLLFAAHAVAARTALADQESPLLRALDDEIDLARRLVIAVLALRHGDRIRAAVRVVEHGQGLAAPSASRPSTWSFRVMSPRVALPLVRHDLTLDARTAALRRDVPSARGPEEWIADIAGDPEDVWRSTWLAACARSRARP